MYKLFARRNHYTHSVHIRDFAV